MVSYANEMSSPKIGSLVLDCEFNRITLFECRRVVVLAGIETVTKVCDDYENFTFMLG